MSWSVALRLGRVSNLPTVWTNVLAGAAIAGAELVDLRVALLCLAMSLFYVAGMYLNDAFDRKIDALERPERPIPSGEVDAGWVFASGFGFMGAGLCLLTWIGYGLADGTGWRPVAAGAALCAAILFYDCYHKTNPLSPFVMGLCRMLVYVTSGYGLVAVAPSGLFVAAAILLCYLIGLTYVAKQENLARVESLWPIPFLVAPVLFGVKTAFGGALSAAVWVGLAAWTAYAISLVKRQEPGDVSRAVVSLIAGISLVDALFMLWVGESGGALFALAAFGLTLILQRVVPGT